MIKTPLGGMVNSDDKYCLGYAYDLECFNYTTLYWPGLIFPDGSTTKKTECVLMDGVAKWNFFQHCYFGNYLNVNIKVIFVSNVLIFLQ